MERNKWISTHYPRKAVKKPPQEQSIYSLISILHIDYITAVVSRHSKNGPEYFLVQRPETGLLAGLWDFPNIALDDPEIEESSAEDILLEYLKSLGLKKLGKLAKKGSSLHIFTHIRRTSLVYTIQVDDTDLPEVRGKWVTEENVADMAVSELGRKVLRLALGLEKKRKPSDMVKIKSTKVVKLEKGQKRLSFIMSPKTTIE
jgi:A/G-specific adenine glycosylase